MDGSEHITHAHTFSPGYVHGAFMPHTHTALLTLQRQHPWKPATCGTPIALFNLHPFPLAIPLTRQRKIWRNKSQKRKMPAQSVAAYFYVINLQKDEARSELQLPDLIGSDRSSFRNDFPISPAGVSLACSCTGQL